jgi:hypothetical protein
MSGAEFEIVVRGRVGSTLLPSLDDLEVRAEGSDSTCLRGWMPDQAAVHGVLRRLDELGVEVLSLRRLPDHPAV